MGWGRQGVWRPRSVHPFVALCLPHPDEKKYLHIPDLELVYAPIAFTSVSPEPRLNDRTRYFQSTARVSWPKGPPSMIRSLRMALISIAKSSHLVALLFITTMSILPTVSLSDPLCQLPWPRSWINVMLRSSQNLTSGYIPLRPSMLNHRGHPTYDIVLLFFSHWLDTYPSSHWLLDKVCFHFLRWHSCSLCCVMVLFLIHAQFSNKVNSDGTLVHARVVLNAICYPHKEHPQAKAWRDCMEVLFLCLICILYSSQVELIVRVHNEVTSLEAQKCIRTKFTDYVHAVINEVCDHENGSVRRPGLFNYPMLPT